MAQIAQMVQMLIQHHRAVQVRIVKVQREQGLHQVVKVQVQLALREVQDLRQRLRQEQHQKQQRLLALAEVAVV